MLKVNENYKNVKESYLFSEIAARVDKYSKEHANSKIIRMGIGDVTLPLVNEVVVAMQKAAGEMGVKETFRGYGPEQGYAFLRNALVNYYQQMGVSLDSSEIFIGDGAKSDVANITDLFDDSNVIVIPDPVYPVYLDSNLMRGRKIVYIKGSMDNGFLPMPDDGAKGDIYYLCSPNNPTGAVYNREQLKIWVDYANKNGSIILYDSAYEAFIKDESLPRSIYEIEGAKTCAIEFNSFSKTAGFTGTRCGYTVVPKALVVGDMVLNKMWNRRQSTKFNGVSYVVQKGAEAVFEPQAMQKIKNNIAYYMNNAKLLANLMTEYGIEFTGGTNSPYIWFKCPKGMSSWEFFDYLLTNAEVVGTPGSGFGSQGEGFFRLTAFNTLENTLEAIERLKKVFMSLS